MDELYLEFNIPLLKDVAGADLLEVNVAGRYSEYSTFGDTINPKFGFKWKPFEDLLVRGNWGKGFRAPTIAELFTGAADSFPALVDPCDAINLYAQNALGLISDEALAVVAANCAADGVPAGYSQANPQIRTTIGGNPDLQPETSETKTIGFVYSPGFARVAASSSTKNAACTSHQLLGTTLLALIHAAHSGHTHNRVRRTRRCNPTSAG